MLIAKKITIINTITILSFFFVKYFNVKKCDFSHHVTYFKPNIRLKSRLKSTLFKILYFKYFNQFVYVTFCIRIKKKHYLKMLDKKNLFLKSYTSKSSRDIDVGALLVINELQSSDFIYISGIKHLLQISNTKLKK